MASSSASGTIVTFYSWKGGVGRTVALANTAVQLARAGRSVLMIDWDLEAPGLDRYFTRPGKLEAKLIRTTPAKAFGGLLGLLQTADKRRSGQTDVHEWSAATVGIEVPPAETGVSSPFAPTPGRLDLLPSGYEGGDYGNRLGNFSWSGFFSEHRGGEWLEEIRRQWANAYEFVLIDARTGLTDSGGICTVQMPSTLVLVFSANDQSFEGGLGVVAAAQKARRDYGRDRGQLTVIPLLSRWCGDEEVDIAEGWMERFDAELAPLVASWLPRGLSLRRFLERVRVPHVAHFSFGEPLPVLTHSLTDPSLPGLAYDNLARLLASHMTDAGKIIDPAYEKPKLQAAVTEEIDVRLFAMANNPAALHQELAKIAQLHGSESEELSKTLTAAGRLLRRTARYTDAEPLFRRALAIDEKSLGSDHADVAVDLIDLADLLRETHRWAEAEPLYRRALAISEKSLGPDDPSVAAGLNNLALVLSETNRLAEAELLQRRALAIDEKSLGPDDPSVAAGLNNLALLLKDTNRQAEAEPLLRHALAIRERTFGPEDPNVAISLNNLALLLSETGRPAEAEPLYRRALAIDEKSFGPEHPEVATDLYNLADLLRGTQRWEEAEPVYRRALAISEKSFGPDHPTVAVGLNNLALLLSDTKRQSEAEPLYRRALAIDEKSHGPDHPRVAAGLNNLALLLSETGRQSEAEPLYRRAVSIDEKAFGPDHVEVATDLSNLAISLKNSNRWAEAEPLLRRALVIREKNLGPDHPLVVAARDTLIPPPEVAQRVDDVDAPARIRRRNKKPKGRSRAS
jgi:tetratricopeptide (TPR) repeat protein